MELAAKSIRGVAGLMPKEFKWIMQWPLDIADGMVFDIGTASTTDHGEVAHANLHNDI
jgi:hypothetical protein